MILFATAWKTSIVSQDGTRRAAGSVYLEETGLLSKMTSTVYEGNNR